MATYYIDSDNGTDTFSGTRIDSTVDSTADTTHFVDNALTGANDYLNGSFFYNVTRGLGSLITDFDAASDTVTLGTAITGMTAGDTYYILNAWATLDKFLENSRSAGDKAILRRGRTATYQSVAASDLSFNPSGFNANPIITEADYDNVWADQVDLSGTATATLMFGSKTVTFSADISSVLAAGDWIYASGDNNREFAYEVASVVTTTVTLYLPYKGNQAGSGRTMYNMQDNPIWNTAAGDFQWLISFNNYLMFQGLHIRGTDANGVVQIASGVAHWFKDCIFEGNGASDYGIYMNSTLHYNLVFVEKCRFYNQVYGIYMNSGGDLSVNSCLFDNNSVANSYGIVATNSKQVIFVVESEFINNASRGDIGASAAIADYRIRNCLIDDDYGLNYPYYINNIGTRYEDYNGTPGDTRTGILQVADNTPVLLSETTEVRSGGSSKSIKVVPSTSIGNVWDINRLKIFELPIYATTASKTYTIYFKSSATANWTNDPTASELWIELEAWGHATNNFRKITKSTGVIDMNGDATNWQSLEVTVAPAQAGVAYLRCWYAKTKEAGSNIFYVDPIPVIT